MTMQPKVTRSVSTMAKLLKEDTAMKFFQKTRAIYKILRGIRKYLKHSRFDLEELINLARPGVLADLCSTIGKFIRELAAEKKAEKFLVEEKAQSANGDSADFDPRATTTLNPEGLEAEDLLRAGWEEEVPQLTSTDPFFSLILANKKVRLYPVRGEYKSIRALHERLLQDGKAKYFCGEKFAEELTWLPSAKVKELLQNDNPTIFFFDTKKVLSVSENDDLLEVFLEEKLDVLLPNNAFIVLFSFISREVFRSASIAS